MRVRHHTIKLPLVPNDCFQIECFTDKNHPQWPLFLEYAYKCILIRNKHKYNRLAVYFRSTEVYQKEFPHEVLMYVLHRLDTLTRTHKGKGVVPTLHVRVFITNMYATVVKNMIGNDNSRIHDKSLLKGYNNFYYDKVSRDDDGSGGSEMIDFIQNINATPPDFYLVYPEANRTIYDLNDFTKRGRVKRGGRSTRKSYVSLNISGYPHKLFFKNVEEASNVLGVSRGTFTRTKNGEYKQPKLLKNLEFVNL
jgi:hypothetical protein